MRTKKVILIFQDKLTYLFATQIALFITRVAKEDKLSVVSSNFLLHEFYYFYLNFNHYIF